MGRFLAIIVLFACSMAQAEDKIKYWPRIDSNGRMNGGQFQAAQTKNGPWTSLGWSKWWPSYSGETITLPVGTLAQYKAFRYLGPSWSWGTVAEIEFIQNTEKITGKVFGTPGSWGNYGSTVDKAFDGDINTYWDAPDWAAENHAGIERVSSGDIDLAGYELAFEDNFDTLSVDSSAPTKDSSTWYYWPPYGPSGDYGGVEWSVANTETVQDGALSIKAWYDPALDASHPWKEWRSGNISSKDERGIGFSQRFGYFSARIKMPNAGTGAFPAFWLFSDNSIQGRNTGQRLEIDIVEWFGKNPANSNGRSYASSIHNWNDGGSQGANSVGQFHAIDKDLINEWHVYGCLWRPDYTAFFSDGAEMFRVPTNLDYCNNPLFIMVDYALGGGWPLFGEPYANRGPSTMQVDWVRAYKLPTSVVIPPLQPAKVTNPGFEDSPDGAQEVAGWGEWSDVGSNPNGKVRSAGSHSGARHYSIEGVGRLYQSQVVAVRELGIYTFKAWVKTAGTQNMIAIGAKEYGGPSKDTVVPSTSAWTQVEVRDISVTNGQCRIGLWVDSPDAASVVSFDDVTFLKQ